VQLKSRQKNWWQKDGGRKMGNGGGAKITARASSGELAKSWGPTLGI